MSISISVSTYGLGKYLESQWLVVMGYFKAIMVCFGVEWPTISSYLAVQVYLESFEEPRYH